MEEGGAAGEEKEGLGHHLTTLQNIQPRERLGSSWYDLVSEQLQALMPRFGLERVSAQLYRAYDLICSESLGLHPGAQATRSSRLNHDGTPIQYALALGRGAVALQFLSEAGDPELSYTDRIEFVESRVRTLSALLQLKGDLDYVGALIDRTAAMNAHEADPDRGGTFWIGTSFAPGGKRGLKIYINGKNGTENEQWARLDRFAAHFGDLEKQHELRRLVTGKMLPLGMAISLSGDESPAGRVYFSGYGNRVSYYEHLLRHCGGEQHVDAFGEYTEMMLGEDRAYPTQSVVFSVGICPTVSSQTDAKIEFCGHCLFQSDSQALDRCLRWLSLRKIDARHYVELLDVIAGSMSPAKVNTHIYLGLGWQEQQEYTTIYLKPHPVCASTCR